MSAPIPAKDAEAFDIENAESELSQLAPGMHHGDSNNTIERGESVVSVVAKGMFVGVLAFVVFVSLMTTFSEDDSVQDQRSLQWGGGSWGDFNFTNCTNSTPWGGYLGIPCDPNPPCTGWWCFPWFGWGWGGWFP